MKRVLLAILLFTVSSAALAQPHWGDFEDGGTRYFYTNTVGTDGVAETIASEAIAVYKDGSATELTTGATIDDDFDSRTGFHQIAIDTTQSGFDAGAVYTVMYTAGTVDSVSVAQRVIGTFRLVSLNLYDVLENFDGSLTAIQTKTGYLPSATAGAAGGLTIAGANAATTFATLTSTGALTINGTSHVAQTGDSYAIVNSGTHGLPALKTLIDTVDDFLDTEVAAIKTKTEYLPSATAGAAGGLTIAGSNAATTFATLTSTGAFTINGTSDVAQTGDSFARIGATGSGLTSLAQASLWTSTRAGYLDRVGSYTELDGAVYRLTANALELAPATTTLAASQAPVPTARTFKLKRTADGLVGEAPIGMKVGTTDLLFQVDFAGDLATNGRVTELLSVEIVDGEEDGVTFDYDPTDVDKTNGKFHITADTAGTYEIDVEVEYDDSDGGGTAIGTVELIVHE